MFPVPRHAVATALLVTATLAACDSSPTAPRLRRPVSLSIAPLGSSASVASLPGMQFSTARLSIGQTSLGAGDQFGCQDCQTEGSEAEQPEARPTIVTIPATGGPVVLATEQVQPGTYREAQIDLVQPSSATLGDSPANTVEVVGTYQGRPFDVAFPVVGAFIQQLIPPVTVTASSAQNLTTTITLPLAAWFSRNGAALDPNDPAQRSVIAANIRAFVTAEAKGERPE